MIAPRYGQLGNPGGHRLGARPGANLYQGLVVDNFAGGGGASMGIEAALGRCVDFAINHDRASIEMHAANHPHTYHMCEDVWDVDPAELCGGRRVQLAWFSPDCKHFSKAKGGRPVSPRVRGLAWVVIRWAKAVRPDVIMLENVEEFTTWGPLVDGRPCPKRKGQTFRSWTGMLRRLGYDVQWRELRACDYGAPTIRKRLFLIARCDGKPIRWPEKTHGNLDGVRLASLRSRNRSGSLVSGLEGSDCSGGGATERSGTASRIVLKPYRTAAEIIDWSIPCPSIFERKKPLAEKTLRRIANGLKRFVIDCPDPFIIQVQNASAKCGCRSIHEPFPTITAHPKGGGHALVAPTLMVNTSGHPGARADEPLRTVTTGGHHALVSAFLAMHFGGMTGVPIETPLPTTTVRGTQNQVVAAHLLKLRGTCRDGQDLREPMPTLTSGGTHVAEVRAFLCAYYGNDRDGQSVKEPLRTVTTKDRLGLVTVQGTEYQIVDIGMRMLTPRELARAQGFPDSYILTGTKTSQVARIGNSVCPVMAEALVRANLVEEAPRRTVRQEEEVAA